MAADSPDAPRLRLHGAPRVRLAGSGRERALERKQAALLAFVWLEGPTPRSRLAGLLWPEVSEERARANLRQCLLRLREQAGAFVDLEGAVVSMLPGIVVEPAEPPGAELLAAHDHADCEALSRWLEARRDDERERRKREWLAQVREAAQSMRLDDALYAADQLLQADRESEETYRVLMEVFYLRGDHAAAISAWDRCRTMLRELYGVQPSAATRELGGTILRAAQVEGEGPAHTPLVELPAAVLRPPRMIGRSNAMAALTAGWRAGDTVCIEGEAGLGKSRLLADFESVVGRCAVAAARPGDAVLPYATLSRLVLVATDRFCRSVDSADTLSAAKLLPRLRALVPAAMSVASSGGGIRNEYERSQALLATARLLGACARGGCHAFVVDDIHFADAASIEALRLLAEPGAGRPHATAADHPPASTCFVLAMRREEIGPEAETLLASLGATGRLRRVVLAPLCEAEATEVISSLALAPEVAALARRVWQQVGGNPAFMLESLKLLISLRGVDDSGNGQEIPLPASIHVVLQRRLEMLTPRARHLAQLAAVAGPDYSVALASAALACPVIELSEPLRELELRQVFYGRRFVHDLIAMATLRSVAEPVAEFMHRFVAEHLAAVGGEPAAIAAHWRACGEWRRAGRAFAEAAAGAASAARFREWGELLDAASTCLERDPAAADELFAVLLERAEAAEARAQPAIVARDVERLVELARSPVQRLQALATQIGWHTDAARTGVPLEAVKAGIDEALSLGRPALALQLAQPLCWQLAMQGRLEEAMAILDAHEPWVLGKADARTRSAFHRTRAAAYGFCDRLEAGLAEGRRSLAALDELGDWTAMLPALSNLGLTHFWRGEFEAARAVLEQARAIRHRLEAGGAALMIDVHLGAVLRDLGELDGAQAMLESVLATIVGARDGEDARTERIIVENHLAELWLVRGDPTLARASLASDDAGIGIRFRARRALLRLRVERLHGGAIAARQADLLALMPAIDSPMMLALAELEIGKLAAPDEARVTFARLHDSPVSSQRPGLRLHAAVLCATAHARAGMIAQAARWTQCARELRTICHAFDLPARDVEALLGKAALV